MSFIASEVHPAFSEVLHVSPTQKQEVYSHCRQKLRRKLLYLEQSLLHNKTLVMGKFHILRTKVQIVKYYLFLFRQALYNS
ncbi:hypothetical protein EON65_39975 [archaeon]|nr:MAG: hypothetical protein EON65_39975 [archaeon]